MSSDKTNENNQRDFYRCDVEIPFSFSIIKGKEVIGPYQANTVNISGGGMFFTTTCPMLQAGILILAEFALLKSENTSPNAILSGDFMARVIRDDAKSPTPLDTRHYLLAVEFKFLHKATKNDIIAYINQHEAYRRHQKKHPAV